jgi:hypothetical protein
MFTLLDSIETVSLMQGVGRADVDNVDIGIGIDFLVAGVGFWLRPDLWDVLLDKF